ncbi:MAG: hypothetical protein KBC17_01680 [Candidatus Pacebacteria bacterium]|nr:hypothetical protein [Candidatus Paceibacterota bacterium]
MNLSNFTDKTIIDELQSTSDLSKPKNATESMGHRHYLFVLDFFGLSKKKVPKMNQSNTKINYGLSPRQLHLFMRANFG